MTSPDSSPPPRPPEGRAPKPQPKPRHGARPPESEAAVGSGSATGFVSMLAKRQFDADVLAATPGDEAARRDRLQMAREVAPEAAPKPAAPAVPAVPGWYKVAFWMSLVLAVLLLGIGVWAMGALVYMLNVAPMMPQEVHYPLISWRYGGYTGASRFMAWVMLLCVPVAGLLVVMAGMLRARMKGR